MSVIRPPNPFTIPKGSLFYRFAAALLVSFFLPTHRHTCPLPPSLVQVFISHATTPLTLLLGSLPFSLLGCALPLLVGRTHLTHRLVMIVAALTGRRLGGWLGGWG